MALEDIIVRLQAMLQHLSIDQPDDGLVPATRRLAVSDLVMDEKQRTVWRGDQLLELNSEEFALLRFLMHNPGRVISATEIFEQIWFYDFGPHSHALELYIGYLRQKVDAGREPLLHVVAGPAYMLGPKPP
ncbi:hypothetical protein GCM10009527_092580 [Actinomadura nitritigenes]|uniref:Response regulator transcription factor n=1 Tax=Actinomadura nitritigenes TaxID=134602 RepID=A0ABS3RGP3_9ACTN|nr:winged helix-turn-helix domain-containing protein [Actinomadura nitritigenes]MBO2445405.1 response regulator transcription factor [Actinomadura nitritigenes]